MTDEELLNITNHIEEKLGKESSAIIADDIGLLMTGNSQVQKTLQEKDSEIQKLKTANEKLILANGNLLKQVPVEGKTDQTKPQVSNNSESVNKEGLSLSAVFDKTGKFLR